MNANRIRLLSSITIALGLSLGLTSCDKANAPATPAPSQATQDTAAPTSLTGFAIGNFIDPKTFAVGGQSDHFKTTDYLYATTALANPAPGTEVTVQVIDSNGKELLKKSSKVTQAENSLNIDLDVPKGVSLSPGTYAFKALLNGKEASSHNITIE